MFDPSMNRETSNAKIIHNAESNELVATEEVTSRHAENLLEEIQHMAGFFGSCFDLLYFSLIFFNTPLLPYTEFLFTYNAYFCFLTMHISVPNTAFY